MLQAGIDGVSFRLSGEFLHSIGPTSLRLCHACHQVPFVRRTGNDTQFSWWRHQMEIFSALLAICAENSPISGEFRAQRPVTRSFDIFFDLRLNIRLSKHWWGWWFETPSRLLWRHRNVTPRKISQLYSCFFIQIVYNRSIILLWCITERFHPISWTIISAIHLASKRPSYDGSWLWFTLFPVGLHTSSLTTLSY